MLYNIGYTNTTVICHHSTVITNVMLLYNTEWLYDHEMVVNYRGKKFYNIGPRCQHYKTFCRINLLPFYSNTTILCYEMMLLW
jgi:hypothetical protein